MTTKWADYIITCVTYTADGSRISTVGVWIHEGNRLLNHQVWHRAQVVAALSGGSSFVTATLNADRQYTKGAVVGAYIVNGEWFIKTAANHTASDNLGNLPPCT